MMPKINRLTGRFFTVLISLSVAVWLPRAAVAGEASPRPPLASPAAVEATPAVRADLAFIRPFGSLKDGAYSPSLAGALVAPWPTTRRFTPFRFERREPALLAGVASLPSVTSPASLLMAPAGATKAPAPTLCQISDTVYRADGSPAQGTVLLSWPAFTTAAGQAVSPGSLLVTLDANGGFNASLAPNTGASPTGTYYKAIFKLGDGTTETEYWVVPNIQSTTIGAVRSKLVPSNQAAQFLTRDVAESNYMNLTTNETVAGIKTFSSSPVVPTPANATDAANKAYVDANAGNLASPGPIGSGTPNTGAFTALTAQNFTSSSLPEVNLQSPNLPGGGVVGDGRTMHTCSITSGSKVVNCSEANFVSADVGKGGFFQGAGTAGKFLQTTIASVQSSTQVTLADAAGTTVASGGAFTYGTLNDSRWCAAVDCTNPTSPNVLATPQPGRTLRLPRGMYIVTGTIYTRCGDNLVGDGVAGSQVWQFDASGAKDVLAVGSHSVGGTPTADVCTLLETVQGVSFFQPEALTSACINTMGLPGVDLTDNWFICNNAIKATGSGLRMLRNTCDNDGGQCIIVSGNGTETDNNTQSVLIEDTDCYAQRYACFQVDGASDVIIHHNFVNYAKQFGLFLASPTNQTSYRVMVTDNSFITSTNSNYYNSTQSHIYMASPCVGCQISGGNKFMLARKNDIDLESSGIAGLKIMGNQFYGAQGTSLNVGVAGAGLTVRNNNFDRPGSYGGDFSTPALVSGNWCHNPFTVAGLPSNDYDKACFRFANASAAGSKATDNVTDSTTAAALAVRAGAFPFYSSGNRSGWATGDVYVYTGAGNAFASANERAYNGTGVTSVFTTLSDPATGNAGFSGNLTVGGELSARDIPGALYFVSKYAGIQAAINAAYNNGAVLGTVVDDRTAPYSGPGFILYDSVTLQLAATTYTITSTVTYNNGNNNVTAGIIAVPGARLIGASTSTNHGTIITAGNGLNTDLIATSTVGTGIGSAAQWWHWGGFENLRVTGNGANQTAGNCFNIENMGETAFLRTIEVSGCKVDNILFTGASATPSDIANITTNSAGRYGFNFNNLAGVAVVHGLSGDSNATSIVRLNGGQSGTLTILGFKTEEEVSGQDPLITIDETGQSGAQPSLFIVGGYTFGRSGVIDVIKYVNGTLGTTPYISVSNFYVQDYANAVNDVVNSRTTAATNMNKVPFYYGPTGAFYSGQAFTLDLNTFVQSPHSGNYTLTEVFGTTSSNETLLAGSGTSTSLSTGGIGFRMANRSVYGQTPELFAKMTYAFPGGVPNPQQWEFIPAKVGGDNSTRWIGDPSYRWDEIYSADVNTTTATVGTLNVTTCTGCGIQGAHLVGGSMQGNTATLTGNSSDQTVYSAALPAGTFAAGTGVRCKAQWQHTVNGSTAITYKWTLGSASLAYAGFTSASTNLVSEVEVLTPASLAAQIVDASALIGGTTIQAGPNTAVGNENLANADTIKFTFNAGNGEQVKGIAFYCQTVQ